MAEVLNESDLSWQAPKLTGSPPSKRSGHSLTIVGRHGVVFGGMVFKMPPGPSDEVFTVELGKNALKWSKPDTGDIRPSARWSHTAVPYEGRVVVFGGFKDNNTRLNDVWVFNVANASWEQPECSSAEIKDTPHPRGSHGACVVGTEMYVFGGYGGAGFGRHDFNDMYTLDLETWVWEKVVAKGTAPEPRSGHAMVRNRNEIYVVGGWNSTQQFKSLHIFDTTEGAWREVELEMDTPRWGLAAVSVAAIPDWKVFVFGGQEGDLAESRAIQGEYSDHFGVLTAGRDEALGWWRPEPGGETQQPRSDAAIAYDAKNSRLVLFGGWCNRWVGTIHTMDVRGVVGPPYAISAVEPRTGPITGGNPLTIRGIDFVDGSISVRFKGRKGVEEVPGEFVSSDVVECQAPNFMHMGAGAAEVRVSCKGDPYTVTTAKYEFFAVANADRILPFGPALVDGVGAGVPAEFAILSRDKNDNTRVCGGDEFRVAIKGPDGTEVEGVEVEDRDNGTYVVRFTYPGPGKYSVDVEFLGSFGAEGGRIRGMPAEVDVSPEGTAADNELSGSRLASHLSSSVIQLKQLTRDTLNGLRNEVSDGNLAELLEVKEHMYTANQKKKEVEFAVDQAKATGEFLTAAGTSDATPVLKKLAVIATEWEAVQKQLPQTRNAIAPNVKVESVKTREQLEKYEAEMERWTARTERNPYWVFETGYQGAQEALKEARVMLADKRGELKKRLHVATMFEFPEMLDPVRKRLDGVENAMGLAVELWELAREVDEFITATQNQSWKEVDAEKMEDNAKQYQKKVRKLNKDIRSTDAYRGLDRVVKDFMITCPLVSALHHDSMRERHWQALMKGIKKEFPSPLQNPDMQLSELLQHNLHEHAVDVEEITDQAMKEATMEKQLKELKDTWDGNIVFLTTDFKDGVKMVRIGEEDFDMLENHQLMVQGMMASVFVKTFEDEIMGWNSSLSMVSEVIQLVGEVQRTWSYLEPLFMTSVEVRSALPEDAKLFEGIDTVVKGLLRQMVDDLNVLKACNREGVLKTLEEMQEQLDQCKKSLSNYLDGKRQKFPRFYFVSESDLLDILSNGIVPSRIMKHVSKVLLATDTLTLDGEGENPNATRWVSGVGKEEVAFEPPIPLVGKVEDYLRKALEGQQSTLSNNLKQCIERYPDIDLKKRGEWLMASNSKGEPQDAAAIAVLVAAINYVREAEKYFDEMATNQNALKEYSEKQVDQLNELIGLTRTKLSKQDRTKVMVMITMDTHSRDIIHRLIAQGVTSKTAFQWQSQLKQRYRAEEERVDITILDATFQYGYEYLGNGPRLVITPLTDRIYVTATQALNLKMGCAPAGPAGTGKTETTKDLASALGKICYVFNCSPEMDYKSMGNIFKGLAAAGSWGCFDEFNRLIPEVLSVCSVQFKAVCDAVRERNKTVTIEGDTVSCDWTVGVFITMNPGYLGRSELPEGLKALFRPITVMVPDLVLICENMLMAEGFKTAKVLASKFYGLYSLLSELLSKQSHYDWGLRAVKSVLVVAGAFLRAEPDLVEQELLMRALRDMNTPKIVSQDRVVFFGLLGDLFPGIDPPRKSDPDLEKNVEKACGELKLHPDEYFRLKCVQLDELMEIRHCTFVMGPPGCGKSMCWKNLAKAKGLKNAHVRDLNPKAITTEQLYGYVTMATREWKDGLLSVTMRDLGQIPDTRPKWIILDGDLDANWIESMNSVMDDNKMLTLASNERIPLKAHMKMLFEIRDLRFASPATVSRAGILWISTDKGTQWRAMVKAWVANQTCDEPGKEALQELFDTFVPPSLEFIRKEIKTLVPIGPMTMVQTLLYMLEGLVYANTEPGKPPAVLKGDTKDEVKKELGPIFVFSAVWALGSSFAEKDGVDYADMFSEWWKKEFSGQGAKFPSRGPVFDHWLDPETGKFDKWENSPYFYAVDFDSSTMKMGDVTVPTPETCSRTFWMDMLVKNERGVMLVGNAGCGKTQLVFGLLNSMTPQKMGREVLNSVVNFNFFTTAEKLRTTLEAPLEKKTGTNFAPKGTASMIFFLDDLNLPELDAFDTQSAIALVRQHIDYGKWYDPFQPQKGAKNIKKCQYIASMNPTAGSFAVNPRLQRHFATFAVGFPSTTSLLAIYQTFLDGHLKDFTQTCQEIASTLIKAALSLHNDVTKSFRKSAVNFHYEFNIRHLSNVFQGVLTAKASEFSDPEKLVHLWLHESERVYGDRLVNHEDIATYKGLAQKTAKKQLGGFNVTKFFASENPAPLIFTFDSERVYDQVTSMEDLSKGMRASLEEYNETFAAMDLVLFADAVRHVCRIARIILNPGGHALLVGVGGSGKQSLSRLAAHICGYSTVKITVSSTYSITDLKESLQEFYKRAALKEEGILFLFTDSQITNERFLVYINDLLASGDIPDLWAQDDKDAIIGALTNRVKAAGLVPDADNSWNFFLDEVRKNLHMALCFSPVGDDFRTRALRFPALVNCTVIDWFQPWPEDALYSVGRQFIEDEELGSEAVKEGVARFLPHSFKVVNTAAQRFLKQERRYCYTTPKSFLELVALYKSLLGRKREDMTAQIDRLANGLHKLRQTADVVADIRADLEITLKDAEEKKDKADGIAAQVAKEKAIVEEATAEANVEAEKCGVIQRDVEAQATDCAADLAKAEPAVEAAMEALNTLDKKDLGTCKTMSTPPKGVDDVFAAVMALGAKVFLFDGLKKNGTVKDASWGAAKKLMLGNINEFLDNLKGFKAYVDDQSVPTINFREVRKYLELEHLTVEGISSKNSAAGGLCSWVINIVMYYDIVVTVEPKRLALAEANRQLSEANTKLEAVQKQVAELQAKLDKLTAEFNAANAEKQEAIDLVNNGKRKLNLAERLTQALADENVRWGEAIKSLTAERELLVGDVLLAAAFISYIGPFTKKYRDSLINEEWVPFLATAAEGETIPMSETANPVNILTDEAQIASWSNQALPTDRVSVENGCIVTNSARWPLLIDPQLQGIAWLREKEKDNSLNIVRLGQQTLMRTLEKAISGGEVVIIENMGERIDAALMPLIQRATIKKGHKQYLLMNNKEIDMSPKFQLYMHTKLSNPHYPPEIQAECTLCNFSVTEDGLEDQLLALVVKKERNDLARTRTRLIQEMNSFKIRIKELEDDILARLAKAEGDITEDVELIESLENTKKISNEINEKVVVAKQTTAEINETSEKYRPVAARGSLLFFLMNELYKVHTYYVYSLNAFVVVFLRGIDLVTFSPTPAPGSNNAKAMLKKAVNASRAIKRMERAAQPNSDPIAAAMETDSEMDSSSTQKQEQPQASDDEIAARCDELMGSITAVVFKYMRRGLFETDKLMVATQLCLKVLVRAGELVPSEVSALVLGPVSVDAGAMGPVAEWLPEQLWPRVKGMEVVKETLGNLGEHMQEFSDEWRKWFDEEKPEDKPMPGDYKTLSDFHKLLVLRAMRPDRLLVTTSRFVAKHLGEEYVNQPVFDMKATYNETSSSTPTFFVLFPGVDPTVWVEGLGKEKGISLENGLFINISMGQGQEQPAEEALKSFAEKGGWVMLQNCHLMQSWLPRLERTLELVSEGAHEDFRCFLSAEPPPMSHMKNMPESLMQTCIKVANEAPADLKSNLRRSWAMFDPDWVESNSKPDTYKGCLFSLCMYHSIILGRRRFGQQGWSRKYSFNNGDLSVCANVCYEYLNDNPDVPWDDLRYIFGEIMYGGHITDYWDRRTNNTYLQVLFTQLRIFGEGAHIIEGFPSPNVKEDDHEGLATYIEEKLPPEEPKLFGLHANAEIGYLTASASSLFNTILMLEGGVGGGEGEGSGQSLYSVIEELQEALPENFRMIEIEDKAEQKLEEQGAPFVVVAIQECTRMNMLLSEIRRTLKELKMGLDGELNMTDAMEDLSAALSISQVPGRNPFHKCSWEAFAWWSKKSLMPWFKDMKDRVAQLVEWVEELQTPKSLWLPGMFNPTAFLTAIMQVTARKSGKPLDQMTTTTHVTKYASPKDVPDFPEDGAFIHGWFLEGARWLTGEEAQDEGLDIEPVSGVPTLGHLTRARLKELLSPLPVIYVQAVVVEDHWMPESVGYLRKTESIYECPVYNTTFRGPTYVFLATLKTSAPAEDWVLAGVAIIQQTDE